MREGKLGFNNTVFESGVAKIFSCVILLLVFVVMVFGRSINVHAQDTPTSTGEFCDGINWEWYEDDNRLVFKGIGEMKDYSDAGNFDELPFSIVKDKENVQLEISDGITKIGSRTFHSHNYIGSVSIGKDVTTINSFAFYKCKNIKSISFPYSLTTISTGVFNGCESLKEVVFPYSVKTIGRQAFYNCVNLTKIKCGYGLDDVANDAFGIDESLLPDGQSIKTNVIRPTTVMKNYNWDNSYRDYYSDYKCTLTLKSLDGTEVLETVEATNQGGDYCNAYLDLEKYIDCVFLEDNGGVPGGIVNPSYIVDHDIEKVTGMYFPLEDDCTLYVYPPKYMDKVLKYDLSKGKTLDLNVSEMNFNTIYKLDSDEADDFLMYFYFYTIISQKFGYGEFGDISSMTSDERSKKYLESTFYVTPYTDFDKLTEGDKWVAKNFFGESRIIPHISLEKETNSVMKINFSVRVNDENESCMFMTFSGVESDAGIKEVLALDLGRFPPEGSSPAIYYNEKKENLIFSCCKLYITFGNGDAPAPAPQPEPEDDSDITKLIPYSENVPVADKEKVIKKTNTDKTDVAGSNQKYYMLKGVPKGKNSIKLTWKSINYADGYIVYGAKCGKKLERIAEIKNGKA
ncbi:MAG: leucine-rich repeat domain-containing protein, partial [Eubacterium sp.]|nr:leucine-rich repeat domain-containing protein [Eubacterium sp.]